MEAIRTIGILGGSFNPPHTGHLTMAEQAYKRLGFNEVWFLVSPQNPLKEKTDTAPFDVRFELCKDLAEERPWLKVSDFEQNTATNYTLDTLRALKRTYPDCNFVWLMGSDNLSSIHTWQGWNEIFLEFPIVVLYREQFSSLAGLESPAAEKYSKFRVEEHAPLEKAPQWRVLFVPPHVGQATHIRQELSSGEEPSHMTPRQKNTLKKHPDLWED